jgi:hypothetical protein
VLEVGAGEGWLTRRLSQVADVECVETAPTYRAKLESSGYRTHATISSEGFDLTLVAAVLEYMDEPVQFLDMIQTKYVLTDTILSEGMRKVTDSLRGRYRELSRVTVIPRWEKMYHGDEKEDLDVYKLGSDIRLFEKMI